MLSILATTKALNYGGNLLAKTHDGLRRIAKLGCLKLLSGSHAGEAIGEVTGLCYRRGKDGLGYLMGEVPIVIPTGHGCSLQYEGSIRGGKIMINPAQDMLHVAIVNNPRDTITMRDASTHGFLFTDSDDSVPSVVDPSGGLPTVEAEKVKPIEVPAVTEPVPEPAIEVSSDDLVQAILSSQPAIDLLLTRILASEELTKAISDRLPKVEPVAPAPITRLVVTTKQPDREIVRPANIRPKQQAFQALT